MTRNRARGFTLIELGIVIGVAAILAAALVPDFIEAARNRMVEKAAVDMTTIEDTARWYFVEQARTNLGARWPGETAPGDCNNGALPAVALTGKIVNDLSGKGFLPPSALLPGSSYLVNPWGQPYELFLLQQSNVGTATNCMFTIATNMPAALFPSGSSLAFTTRMPQATCDTVGGNASCWPGPPPPAGYVRCCSYIPKPGAALNPCQPPFKLGVIGNQVVCQ